MTNTARVEINEGEMFCSDHQEAGWRIIQLAKEQNQYLIRCNGRDCLLNFTFRKEVIEY